MRTPRTVTISTSEELFGSESVPAAASAGPSTRTPTSPTENCAPTGGVLIVW